MTCRGSRFADGAKRNPNGEVFMKNRETDEWLKQNERSTRNFLRKWGHFCKHDEFLKPIIPSKYDIGFIIKNCHLELLKALEPWCSTVYCDEQFKIGRYQDYIEMEQVNTQYDLQERILPIDTEKQNDILIEIDGNQFSNNDFRVLQTLSEILDNDDELQKDIPNEFEIENLKVTISSLKTYENELIICK